MYLQFTSFGLGDTDWLLISLGQATQMEIGENPPCVVYIFIPISYPVYPHLPIPSPWLSVSLPFDAPHDLSSIHRFYNSRHPHGSLFPSLSSVLQEIVFSREAGFTF